MLSLFFRNLFFTLVHPGLVAGLFPYLILGDRFRDVFDQAFGLYQYLGIGLFLIGLVIMCICIFKFAVEGHGTLSPADPTKQLVSSGLYRFSRNPMYVGVLIILAGEVIFFQSIALLLYLIIVFLLFNVFIIWVEEPRLRKDFGEQYTDYCGKVSRWF